MDEVTRCPWCAEEILAAAKKCKHCGEFLTSDGSAVVPSPSEAGPGPHACPTCLKPFATARELYLHRSNDHGLMETVGTSEPVWRFAGIMWRCVSHDKVACATCAKEVPPPSKPGKKGDVF